MHILLLQKIANSGHQSYVIIPIILILIMNKYLDISNYLDNRTLLGTINTVCVKF